MQRRGEMTIRRKDLEENDMAYYHDDGQVDNVNNSSCLLSARSSRPIIRS